MGLYIDSPEINREINRVHTYALENPIIINSPEDVNDILPVGDNPKYVIKNGTYKIVFSYENQMGRLFRHFSISTATPEKYPSIELVQMIIKKFGFKIANLTKPDPKTTVVHLDEKNQAINIIELV